MAWSGKKLAGIGCGVLVIGAVMAAGSLTWYSTQLSREYKKVTKSEQELLTALPAPFAPPANGVPDSARVAAFAAVRDTLAEWRTRMATEDRRFAERRGGNWFLRAGDASDLAQVMAGYWLARNEALRREGMGAAEYEWLYGLVYYAWLGHDAAAGRQAGGGSAADVPGTDADRFEQRRAQWQAGATPGAAEVLEPLRGRLAAGWTEETNPIELIFVGAEAATRAR